MQASNDREAIIDLYIRYARSADAWDYPAWVQCFTEDGVFFGDRFGRQAGRARLLEFCNEYRAKISRDAPVKHRHLISNISIHVDGDRATGRSCLVYYHTRDRETRIKSIGEYRDVLRKVDGHWLIVEREVVLD